MACQRGPSNPLARGEGKASSCVLVTEVNKNCYKEKIHLLSITVEGELVALGDGQGG